MAIRFWEGDVVYHDKDFDVLEVPLEGLRSTGAAGGVELSARRPPEKFIELGASSLRAVTARATLWLSPVLAGYQHRL